MQTNTIIARRVRGYDDEKNDFDPYDVIAHPLPRREQRVFYRSATDHGVNYGSHDCKRATLKGAPKSSYGKRFFVLESHGGGRSVYEIEGVYDGGTALHALRDLPEPILYAILHAFAHTGENAYRQASKKTAHLWADAYLDGRIRRSRKRSDRRVRIETEAERAIRLEKRQRNALTSVNA